MHNLCYYSFSVPPDEPRALLVQNIGATWVNLRWEPPLEVDFPISYYEIIAASAVDDVQLFTPDNNTFINVTGLSPDTAYNLNVVAVIEAGEVLARSEQSAVLEDIMTTAVIGMPHRYIIVLYCVFIIIMTVSACAVL